MPPLSALIPAAGLLALAFLPLWLSIAAPRHRNRRHWRNLEWRVKLADALFEQNWRDQ